MEDILIINKGIAMWGGFVVVVDKDPICFSLAQTETNLTIDGSKHVIG